MADDDRLCYPKSQERSTLKAQPNQIVCYCGRRIEQDEKGLWRHVR